MANEDLKVIAKSKQLAKHTLIVTSNARRYPKKYRFSLVDKMQNKALEIYESLFEANRTDLKDYKRERLERQTKAIAQNVEMSDDDYEECIKMAARGFGIIKIMANSPDMKFEPSNIVFRFPEDDEV